MAVSESCVKALLQRVFLKLGVRTRGQLVRVLMERSPGAQMEKVPGAQFPSDLIHLAASWTAWVPAKRRTRPLRCRD